MSRHTEVWQMTAAELDRIPNYLSGLPTNQNNRRDALEAWSGGGLKGLTDWRAEKRTAEKPVSAGDAYHGQF